MALDIDLLNKLLIAYGVNTTFWGKGNAKGVSTLLKEIQEGESFLKVSGNELVRVCECVSMQIHDPRNPNKGYLIEVKQTYQGRSQARRINPSEKIKFGETPEQALIRGMKEELSQTTEDFSFSFLRLDQEFRSSQSYPGLTCCYRIHRFDVALSGKSTVLRDSFSTVEDNGCELFFEWIANNSGEPKIK